MPKKKHKDNQEAQSKRFVDTAKQLGTDETGTAFNKAISIIKSKNTKNPVQKGAK